MHQRDLHVHTKYCRHADGEMEDYVKAGIEKGLVEIGFLAHAESGINNPRRLWLTEEELDEYWLEGRKLKEEYKNRIHVSTGLELGLNPKDMPGIEGILKRHPWDRIGLSFHYVDYKGELLNICSRKSIERLKNVDPYIINMEYYSCLLQHLSIIKPDFVCHFDVVRKFMPGVSGAEAVNSLIIKILRLMAELGVALEVNTSGYKWIDAPYPAQWILREAADLNIPLVLCSDSHHPGDVGRYFDRAKTYVDEAVGFVGRISEKPGPACRIDRTRAEKC